MRATHRRRSARRHEAGGDRARARADGRPTSGPRWSPATTAGRDGRREPPSPHRAARAADGRARSSSRPATFTPKPQIYSRAQWGANERMRDKGSLRYFEVHAGFVHHTVNANNYTARRGARHPAQHLRLPHPVPGLERHRLQLPRRPVRPDLGGPRTAASTAPSSARTPSATTTTRSRCRRSATSRPPSPPRAMLQAYGSAVRLEAVPARRRRRVDQAAGRLDGASAAINGHRDAGSTACPGTLPLRQAPADPDRRRRGPAGLDRPRARVRPRAHRRTRT